MAAIYLTTIHTPVHTPAKGMHTSVKRNQIDAEQLVHLFKYTFGRALNTYLVSGGEEPEYIPAGAESNTHRIIFTQDYCASALHETHETLSRLT